jgi:hypothetical protein
LRNAAVAAFFHRGVTGTKKSRQKH